MNIQLPPSSSRHNNNNQRRRRCSIVVLVLVIAVASVVAAAALASSTSSVSSVGTVISTSSSSSTASSSSSLRGRHPSTQTELSIWLMPPEPERTTLQQEIDLLAQHYRGPTFAPHVTLLGRVTVSSPKDEQLVIEQLNKAFSKRRQQQQDNGSDSSIACHFSKLLTFPHSWNQALIAEMKVTPQFLELCNLVRRALGQQQPSTTTTTVSSTEWEFPPPSSVPHLSFFYGESGDGSSIADDPSLQNKSLLPMSFDAHQVDVYRTRAGLEYVPTWERIATLDLL